MKQVTILVRALGFLVIAGCSKAKYLLVQIDDVVDEYVQYDDPVYPIDYPVEYPAEYERLKDTLCGGRIIESFKSLQDAKEACDPSYECGCISDDNGFDKYTTHYGFSHYPELGGIAYVRLDRTKEHCGEPCTIEPPACPTCPPLPSCPTGQKCRLTVDKCLLTCEPGSKVVRPELFTARESPFYIPHPNCAVCKQAAAMVEGMVKDKENMDKIKEALTTFCPQIRVVDPKKCKAKADKWAPKIVKLISDNASPEMVCQALMICKK